MLAAWEAGVSKLACQHESKFDTLLDFGAVHLQMLVAGGRLPEDCAAKMTEFVSGRAAFHRNQVLCQTQLQVSSDLRHLNKSQPTEAGGVTNGSGSSSGGAINNKNKSKAGADLDFAGALVDAGRPVSAELLAANVAVQASVESRGRLEADVKSYCELLGLVEAQLARRSAGQSDVSAGLSLPVAELDAGNILEARLLERLAATLKASLAAVAMIDRVHSPHPDKDPAHHHRAHKRART